MWTLFALAVEAVGVTGTQLEPMSANRVVSNVGVDLIQPHFKNQS